MVSVSSVEAKCHKGFGYSGQCDPEAESVRGGMMQTSLKRMIGKDHGQPCNLSKVA